MLKFSQKDKSEEPPDKFRVFLRTIKLSLKKLLSTKESKSKIGENLDEKLVFSLASSRIPTLRQLRYIGRLLSKREILIIRLLLIFILLNLIFLGARFYFVHLKLYPKEGGEYQEGLIGQPQYINPIYASINEVDADLTKLIFSGLLKYDKNQRLVPDLASSWSLSEDEKTYTFFLRKNVKWHDGEPFTAEDVIFTIETIQDQSFKSPLWISFQGVEIKKINNYQIEFILEEPFTPFSSLLTLGILPKHIWQGIGPEQVSLAEANLKPIGTGPFRFEKFIKNQRGEIKSYILERNENYYGRKPYLKKITFKFYQEPLEAIFALKKKKIQGLFYLPKDFKEEIGSCCKDLNHHLLYLPQYTALFFNQKKAPLLAHKGIRLALAHATDKEKILREVLENNGEIIHGPLLPGAPGFNPALRKYPFDLKRADELLEKAGWQKFKKEEGGVVRKKNEEILKLTLTTVDQEENRKVAEIIQKTWQKVGVQLDLQIIPSEEIQRKVIKSRDYQILLYSIITGFDPDPYPFWHSSQIDHPGLNIALFSFKEADQVLEEARMTMDEKARHEKYQHFQNILIEQIPAIFLYSPTYTYLQEKNIRGFGVRRINSSFDRFANIEEWYVRTKRRF
jgi:peptide/nickel transport system substrate-binding protein